MSERVMERVVQVMADVFVCLPTEVAALRAGVSAQWDSVGAASLVVALEDEFGISLDAEMAATLSRLEEIVETISRHLDPS
jgi:acyl carrier protein